MQAAAKQQPNPRTGRSLQEQIGQGAEEAPPTLPEARFSFSSLSETLVISRGVSERRRCIRALSALGRERLPLCY